MQRWYNLFRKSKTIWQKRNEYYDIFAMDTFMTLKAYGENAENAVNLSVQKIEELEKMFSVNDDKSDISKINNAHGKAVEISADTYRLINSAVDICEKTEGCLPENAVPLP